MPVIDTFLLDNLITLFNEDGSSNLVTEGVDFSANGFGIQNVGFETEDGVLLVLDDIREAIERVRAFGKTLAVDMGIIVARQTFTETTVNMLKAGADDLTVADMNEEGANLLALQTRQLLSTTSLSLASRGNANILDLFT